MPYVFFGSSIKFQGHTGWKIDEFNPIWVSRSYQIPQICLVGIRIDISGTYIQPGTQLAWSLANLSLILNYDVWSTETYTNALITFEFGTNHIQCYKSVPGLPVAAVQATRCGHWQWAWVWVCLAWPGSTAQDKQRRCQASQAVVLHQSGKTRKVSPGFEKYCRHRGIPCWETPQRKRVCCLLPLFH